jgi:hypothetical protein
MADFPDQLVSTADFATWMGESFDSDEADRAAWILRVASDWARQIAGKLWPNSTGLSYTVIGIILAAARREFENPRRVVYEVRGPESSSYNQAQYAPGFFTEPEEKALKRFRSGGGLFSIGTYKDEGDFSLGYIGMGPYCKPLPYFNPGDPGWEEADHL